MGMEHLEYITSPFFDPRPEMPAPDVGIFAKPRCWVCVNRQWVAHLAGVLDRLTYTDAWEGTDEEIAWAIGQIECLIAALAGD